MTKVSKKTELSKAFSKMTITKDKNKKSAGIKKR
jgi:hypothetical protein